VIAISSESNFSESTEMAELVTIGTYAGNVGTDGCCTNPLNNIHGIPLVSVTIGVQLYPDQR